MATVDPFTKGGGTSTGSGGALKQNVNPPVIGPGTPNGDMRGGYGPVGGNTNPPHNLPKGTYHPIPRVVGPPPRTPRADKSDGVE